MDHLLVILTQWGAGLGLIVLGSAAVIIICAILFAPDTEELREFLLAVIFIAGIVGGLTVGIWKIGSLIYHPTAAVHTPPPPGEQR